MKSPLHQAILIFAFGASSLALAQNTEADSLRRVLRVAKTDTAKANIYNHLASQFASSNPDSTTFYADMAGSLSAKINYGFGIANAQINKGNVAIIIGKLDEALLHFKKAQRLYESLVEENPNEKSFKNGLARAFASEGIVYSQQSNYYMALENYQKALKLYEEVGQKVNISKALNNIGIVYKAQLNYPKALEYFKRAHKIQREIGEQNEAVTLTNIGVIYFETRQDQEAIQYYNQAKILFEENGNKYGLALVSNYMGDYYSKQLNFRLALDFYQKSTELYDAMQNKFGASLALYNIGKLHAGQKQYAEAMPFAQKSLAYAKEIGVLDQTYHSEKLVSDLYNFLGDPAKSLEHYKNYIAARDSITNQEMNKKFALAEMNFEYKQKEALLNEKNKRQTQFTIFAILGTILLIGLILVIYNRMQVKRRLTLQKEVAEYEQKALHLQMNPHFVFNCLGAISSFIVQNGTDSALKYLSKFSKLMRLTLEYSKGSLIPIDKEIESLRNYLELEQLRFNHKFDFTLESSDKVEFNMGLPPLLIQPFVENAILHGLVPKDGIGKIEVHFDVQNGQLLCTVTDDGIGLSESKNLKENSVTAHKSMALEITRKRLEIMESTTSKSAQIDIAERENQSGTRVTLRLPIQYIQ
ncbi:tetratricopeptide repeat protein [Flavobacterium sp.]|uniref:tetratricopeptide repeat-containing sensor histidine kinase n=1 Tax=Flavobacterium sp. TaxID=239 RepID=UPI0039E2ED8F